MLEITVSDRIRDAFGELVEFLMFVLSSPRIFAPSMGVSSRVYSHCYPAIYRHSHRLHEVSGLPTAKTDKLGVGFVGTQDQFSSKKVLFNPETHSKLKDFRSMANKMARLSAGKPSYPREVDFCQTNVSD